MNTNMTVRTVVTGTGHFVPPRVVTNQDLEKRMDTSDEWIRERSGIRERHHVDAGVGTSDLAVEAARRAIADAGVDPATIDFVIAATLSPDHYFPGIGVIIQAKLGLGTTGALDVRNQCSGFIYALSVADQYIRTGTYKRILLVAAEVQSTNLDFTDKGRDMSVLFGDGAGAMILEPGTDGDGRGVLSTHLFADGNFVNHLWMEKPSSRDCPTFVPEFFTEGRFFPKMEGRNVFVNACQRMPESVRAALEQNGLTIDDVDVLIPHQANDRISLMVAKGLKIPVDKVVRNIDRFGNTTAASIPIALDEAVKSGRVKRGDLVALTAFGSGYTWASALIRW
ncbi:MAG: 3-oxoacyl-ACP synthase [Candidatus Aminicenantes bacterium]|nr:3-oxoacyl-ACP synthase [Candidatus Aminicenantes bacterium]MBS1226301.1 3-oxoacyl-ACP synthase [Candidatus Aminicenantes bacterium]